MIQLRTYVLTTHQLKAILGRGPLEYVREAMSEEHLKLGTIACMTDYVHMHL